MNSNPTYEISDYVDAIRRRRMLFLKAALPILLGAAALAVFLADEYTSVARIDIDLQGSNVRTLEPIELTSYADQYIAKLQDLAMARGNLEVLADESGLFPSELAEMTTSDRIGVIRDSVSIRVLTQPVISTGSGRTVDLISGFAVEAASADPQFAHRVADYVAKQFLQEDRKSRTERASSTSSFLREQMSRTESEIVEFEQQIADFKVANACCLPELMDLNLSVIQRTERDIENLQPRMRTLEKDRTFKQSQIDEIRQQSASTDRLAELEAEYLRLVANYGPEHPDVNRVRREIIAISGATAGSGEVYELVELRMKLAEAEQRYSQEHPDVMRYKREIAALESKQGGADGRSSAQAMLLENSRYLQLRAELNGIETELAELRRREPELRLKIEDYENRLKETPQIESDYQALNRKLQSARDNFDNLQNRAVIARQTEALESTEIGARLIEVRPASLPSVPSGPPRVAIMVIAVFLAGTIGVSAMLLSEMTDSTVRGRKDIEVTMDMLPIATIPVIDESTGHSMRHRQLYLLSGLSLAIVVVVVILQRYGVL
jgi:uncharacterized protein involved in exopolysaccharide biosynthesis